MKNKFFAVLIISLVLVCACSLFVACQPTYDSSVSTGVATYNQGHVHSYSTEWTVDKPATCTEKGVKSHHCSGCDSRINVTEIETLEHQADETGVCKLCGEKVAAVITFNSNGGTEVADRLVNIGTKIGTLELTSYEDHKFLGWYENGIKLTSDYVCRKDVILLAKWQTMVEVVWDGLTQDYDGSSKLPTAHFIDEAGRQIELKVVYTQDDAGTYTATASTTDASYYLMNAKTYFIIEKQPVMAIWEGLECEYDGKGHMPTAYFIDAFGEKVDLVVKVASSSAKSETNVGTFNVEADFETSYASADNYQLFNNSATFVIEPKDTKIVWGECAFMMDDKPHCPTASFKEVDGITSHELSVSVVSGEAINVGTSYVAVADVSQYRNYHFINNNQDFVIYQYGKEVVWSADTFVYNGKTQIPTVVNDSNVTVELYEAADATDVGSYIAKAVSTDSNCYITNSSCYFTITQKPVEAVWNTVTTFTGATQTASAYLKNTDIYEEYNCPLSISGSGIDVGDYTVTITDSFNNFKITNPTETFTINPLQVSLTWSNATTYNGYAQKASAYYVRTDDDMVRRYGYYWKSRGYSNRSTVYADREYVNAGSYEITAINNDANYVFSNPTTTYTINKKSVSISWNTSSFIYNGTPQVPTATFTKVIGGKETLNVRGAAANVGSYTAEAIVGSFADNYSFSCTTKAFTIVKKIETVIWEDTELVYNGENQRPKAYFNTVESTKEYLPVVGGQNDVGTYTASATIDAYYNYDLRLFTTKFLIVSAGLEYEEVEGGYAVVGFGTCQDTNVIVPSIYNSKAVVKIATKAFNAKKCADITRIEVLRSVTEIEEGAFYGCGSLQEIVLPFVGAKAGVKETDDYQYPFGYIFGEESYEGSTKTTQFFNDILTNGITTFRYYYIPSTLTSVVITPKGTSKTYYVTTTNIAKETTKSENISYILPYAFQNCSGLKNITIQNSELYPNNEVVVSGIAKIGNNAFENCSSLEELIIPSAVKAIDQDALLGCDNLTYITYDNGLYIGNKDEATNNNGLYDCITSGNAYVALVKATANTITSLNINSNTNLIYNNAFDGCAELASVKFAGTAIQTLGKDAFADCAKLVNVYYQGSVSNWGKIDFVNGDANPLCNGADLYLNNSKLTSLTASTEIKQYAFYGCTSITNVDFRYIKVAKGTFAKNANLASVIINSAVTEIDDYAFYCCFNLITVTIQSGSKLTRIGDSAFFTCVHMQNVALQNATSLKVIDCMAFCGCDRITSITIPASVNRIGRYAFPSCATLEAIELKNTNKWFKVYCYTLEGKANWENKVSGIAIEAEDLADSAKNAENYINNNTYYNYYWYRLD